MSEKDNLSKLTQNGENELRELYNGMYNKDFATKIDSYQKLATQVSVLRQQGYNVQEYERYLSEYWDNWQAIINNPI